MCVCVCGRTHTHTHTQHRVRGTPASKCKTYQIPSANWKPGGAESEGQVLITRLIRSAKFIVKGSTGCVFFRLIAGIVLFGLHNLAAFGKTSWISVLTVLSGPFVRLLGSICGCVSVLKCPGFWSSERDWQAVCVRICSGEKCPVKFTLWCGTRLEVQVSSFKAGLILESAQFRSKRSPREPELGLTIIHGKTPQRLWKLWQMNICRQKSSGGKRRNRRDVTTYVTQIFLSKTLIMVII